MDAEEDRVEEAAGEVPAAEGDENLGKLDRIKAKIPSMMVEAEPQTILWDLDLLDGMKSVADGPLYCFLCGTTVINRNFKDHVLRNHKYKGKAMAIERESIRAVADAILDQQRRFELDCAKIPPSLVRTEGQQKLAAYFIDELKKAYFPVINEGEGISEDLRVVKVALDAIIRKQDEAAAAHLQLRDHLLHNRPIDEEDVVPAVDAAPADGNRRPDDPEEDEKQPLHFYDTSKDHLYRNYMEKRHRPAAGSERELDRQKHFYHRLIVDERQPTLAKYSDFIKTDVGMRDGRAKCTGGKRQYPSRVARFLLCVMRKNKRLGTPVEPSDVVRTYRDVSDWFTAIEQMGVSDSLVKEFAKALIHFYEWIRPYVQHENFAESQMQLNLAIREVSLHREMIKGKSAHQAALEGSVPRSEQILTPYGVLCSVFRHPEVRKRFVEAKSRVDQGLAEKQDYLFVLRGLIYAIVTLNSSRLDAVYKLREGAIVGQECADGTRNTSTGLQEILLADDQKLWAAPFPMPKNCVSRSDLHKEVRGVVVFEQETREWLDVYANMRQRVMESAGRVKDPEAIFFVNFEGETLDSPAVHHHMKTFLQQTGNEHLPPGCNPVRHAAAQAEICSVISSMYRFMKENHVHTLQGHRLSTLIVHYTDKIYELMATGYIRLRQLEEKEAVAVMLQERREIEQLDEDDDEEEEEEERQEGEEEDTTSDFVPGDLENFDFSGRLHEEWRSRSPTPLQSRETSVMEEPRDDAMEVNEDGNETEEGIGMDRQNGEESEEEDGDGEEVSRFVDSDEYLRHLAKHNRRKSREPRLSIKDDYLDFLKKSNQQPVQGWSWLAVGGSGEAGLGVYAKIDIDAHVIVADYKGVVMSKEAHELRLRQAEHEGNEELRIARDTYWVDGRVQSGYKAIPFGIEAHEPVVDGRIVLGRLINHSKHPNIEICGIPVERDGETHIVAYFKTTKRILKYQQLLFNYGPSYEHLDKCFCHMCSEPKLDKIPPLPKSITLPPREQEALVSWSQTSSEAPMLKRARGYEVRRQLTPFELQVKSQLSWSRRTLSHWNDALNEGRIVFGRFNKIELDQRDSLIDALKKTHKMAKENNEKIIVIFSTQEVAALLVGDKNGVPAAVLHAIPYGFQYAEVSTARHPMFLKGQLTDMKFAILDDLDMDSVESLTELTA